MAQGLEGDPTLISLEWGHLWSPKAWSGKQQGRASWAAWWRPSDLGLMKEGWSIHRCGRPPCPDQVWPPPGRQVQTRFSPGPGSAGQAKMLRVVASPGRGTQSWEAAGSACCCDPGQGVTWGPRMAPEAAAAPGEPAPAVALAAHYRTSGSRRF